VCVVSPSWTRPDSTWTVCCYGDPHLTFPFPHFHMHSIEVKPYWSCLLVSGGVIFYLKMVLTKL
jgi:hypothetical protein